MTPSVSFSWGSVQAGAAGALLTNKWDKGGEEEALVKGGGALRKSACGPSPQAVSP